MKFSSCARKLASRWARSNRIDEVAATEQVKARGFFEEIDHPIAGRRRFPGGPAKFDGQWPAPRRAPLLGEHTAEILTGELKYPAADLVTLAEMGVI